MSFANFDLEAQQTIGKQIQIEDNAASNELDVIIGKTSQQLQLFGNCVSQFENQRKQIGTKRDNQELRTSLDELIGKISDMQTAISKLILDLAQLINQNVDDIGKNQQKQKLEISNKQLIIKDRLINEFNELHKQFQKSERIYHEKTRNFPIKLQFINETTPLIEQQSNQLQSQLQIDEETIDETELQYHVLLTEERNREIEQVSQGITEINSIFKDLGHLITQQGETLDTIEDNILQLHGNTQQADRELTKAHQYQKSKGKWSCIILTALSIIVLIIVLAVVS